MIRSLTIFFLFFIGITPPSSGEEKLNVLFIAVDDLRPELGCYGSKIKTPNFDRLAASGMLFHRAYCQQAVCGASRLSIMGGLYPTLTKEQTFHVNGWRKRHPDLLTMNQHFGNEGFETIGLGKIYHESGHSGVDQKNWTRWLYQGAPEYTLEENRKALEKSLSTGKGDGHDSPKGPSTEMADVPDDNYTDGMRATRAAQVLGDLARDKKQFFFAVGFAKPHLPFVAPKKYWDLYQRSDFSMPSNRGIPPGYPPYAANLPAHELQKYSDVGGKIPTEFDDEMNQRLLHGYAACTSYADANLGVLLDALEKHGLTKNTIVVMWGDHGWKLGDHSSWCKHTNFECDTRVPLLMRVPGGRKGVTTNRLVELIDLYPTLCDLTGIAIPAHCQGRSFKPVLEDAAAGHRRFAYSTYPAHKEIGHSVRFGDFRYTEWHKADGTKSARVFTDLKADPGEVTNSVDDPKYQATVAAAEAYVRKAIEIAMKPAGGITGSETTHHGDQTGIDLPALKAAAKGRFKFGVGTSVGTFDNPGDTALLAKHFDIVTPENCMKSTKVQKQEGVFDFEKADRIVDLAEKNGLEVVGHCLIWARPGTTPPWFFKDGDQTVSKEKLLERLKTHIHTVAGRYRGRVKMWDVVNEALADKDDEYLRDIEWNNILGEEFLVKAFQYAKEADPEALLIYNDYRCDHPGKLKKLIRLIKSVKEQGGPIEALGLQAHYEYGKIPFEGIENAIAEMRKLGVKIVFSELDMDVTTRARWYYDHGKFREEMKSWDPYPTVPPDEILKSQAEQYAKLFSLIAKNSDVVERVTFWNLHDGHSWLNYWPWTRTNHPLLFDRDRKAKPAFHAVHEALEKQGAR